MAYNFDAAFQEKVATHFLRDKEFCASVGTLVEPDYFENVTLGALVSVQKEYWQKYAECPDITGFVAFLKQMASKKRVVIADATEMKRLIGAIYKANLNNRQQVVDEVAAFARITAVEHATLEVGLAIESMDEDKIDEALRKLDEARQVAPAVQSEAVDLRSSTKDRVERRRMRAAGTVLGGGISTGIAQFDAELLPWRGLGRKELTMLMGPPKSGKTAALITLAINAAAAGNNVFYASCEVSKDILADRADANISGIASKLLDQKGKEAEAAIDKFWAGTNGELVIEEFASGTLKVSELRRILKQYEAEGTVFDLVVVDYIDEMAPEATLSDKRHELAAITRGLRALAFEFQNAFLTATQTNREGTKNASRNVTEATDVSEDYNKVRIADAIITINASQEDRESGEVVLYLAAMRNAESGIRLRFKQDLSCMRFIYEFVGRD